MCFYRKLFSLELQSSINTNMSKQKKIAVIGAGPSGLVALKSCLEENFEAICYERSNDLGGLWRYHDEDIEGVASVMRTTIINSTKDSMSFSDFPPPADLPIYMHNRQVFQYFQQYAEQFDLLKHIRCNLEVISVKPTEDFDITGRWIVTVRSTETDAMINEKFDAVMICIGHHVFPNIPTFPGQEKFHGSIVHTHSLKSCDQFKGGKVVVIGIGNSGVDAVVDATYFATQVYLSTRRGSWILSRVGKNGRPFGLDFNTRLNYLKSQLISFDSLCSRIEKIVDEKFDHAAYNLKPKHRILSAHPTMNASLPNAILSGRVVVKSDVVNFEENGILFFGDNTVTEIDTVILATGYKIKFPFLAQDILTVTDNKVHLYKYCIPPHLKHNTLAVIGLIQPLGSIIPISELQSRMFIQVQNGNVKLPTPEDMEKDIEKKEKEISKRFVDTPRHTIQVNFISFMDELATMIGVKPNFFKMTITDPKLFWTCFTGPLLPFQYRLVGPHTWPGARNAILTAEDRIYMPLNKNTKKIPVTKDSFFSPNRLVFFVVMGVVGFIILKHREK